MRQLVWLVLGVSCLCLSFFVVADSSATEFELRIDSARLTLGMTKPPLDSDPNLGDVVQFTDYWGSERRQKASSGWYHMQVHVPDSNDIFETPMGLFIASHSGRATVFWDGNVIGRSVSLAGAGVPIVSGPLLASIPTDLLEAGTHRLQIQFQGSSTQTSFVRAPVIAPLAVLESRYVRKKLTLVYLPVALGVLSVLFALIFYAAYHRDESAAGAGWLVIGLVASAISVLGLYVSLPEPWLEWLGRTRPMAYQFSFLFFWLALRQMLGSSARGPMLAMVFIYLALAAVTLVIDATQTYQLAAYWTLLSYMLGIYILYRAVQLAIKPPTRVISLVPLVLVLLNIIHDGVGIRAGGDFWADQALSIYNPPLFAFALMLTLILRTRMQQRSLLALNAELETRVSEKHAELEANYEKISAAEQREAVLSERERMVREMHDGLGNQLVSTLAMVESGQFSSTEVEEALRDALDDMRVMVHSLDQQETDLLSLLAIVRERLEPRISRQGLRFNWQVADLQGMAPLDPEAAGHVLRIVQESLTNIIKHAQAKTISITTETVGDQHRLMIEDDGLGCGDRKSSAEGGRGLAHMQTRAEQLGGHLELGPGEGNRGTRITLWLPGSPGQ